MPAGVRPGLDLDSGATMAAPATAGAAGRPARRFALPARGTTVWREVLGGAATFLTMRYIGFVDPAVLSAAGLPFEGVTVATAPAAAVLTLAMGLLTNLPFALAPGLVAAIDRSEPESALPAFLVVAAIPLTSSISAGIGLGVLGFVAVIAARGHARDVHPVMWLLVPLSLAFFASDWLSANVF